MPSNRHPSFGLLHPVLLFTFAIAAASAAERRPNVVVFLADDAGWGDYGFNGNTTVATPNIDRIAREGASIRHFYVCAVCSPTRAEFLTGRYHPRGGVHGVSTGFERLDLDERTLADAFAAAGYATGAFGKWHNGSQWPYHPRARGFGEYFGHTSGHWGEYIDAPLEHDGRMVPTTGYIVDVCTDQALRFISAHRARPFFCFVPFTTPHSPWRAPDEDWARWRGRPLTQAATVPQQESLPETRCALAMVENQDRNVGRVLAHLDELGLTRDTIVVYFSDNGPNSMRWNGGMKGRKGSLDEGGLRSPLFLRWPAKIAPGTLVEPVAAAIDLMPTLLSLADVPRTGDKPLDGCDLSPLLRSGDAPWPDRLLFSTWGGKVTVRSQTHRLDPDGRLFDLVEDPGQTTPCNEQEPELARRLTDAVGAWRAEVMRTSTGPMKGRGVDQRPIGVGYRDFPITMLPARDGEPMGGIRRSSSAPNCSYFVAWTSTDDAVVWNVEVVTAGRYRVVIDYTCPLADAGSTIELSFAAATLSGKVTPGWDPPLDTDQDSIPRPPAESRMKPFKPLDLGVIDLPAGQGELRLRARHIPGRSVMDLRRVTLTLDG
jgi:arylsulfatase A-like enzyme